MDYAIKGAILLIFLFSVLLFRKSRIQNNQSSIPYFNKHGASLVKGLQNEETDKLVNRLGICSGLLYQFIRYTILIVLLVYFTYKNRIMGEDIALSIVLWVVLLIISSPRRYLFNKDSPFFLLANKIQKKKMQKLNLEIYRCLSQLKNIIVAKAATRYSADNIICELARYTTHAKPVFNRMLGYWYEARYDQAIGYFSNTIGTKEAKALGSLLLKIDYLKPTELINQIELYQSEAKEERKTAAQTAKENKGNLVYCLVMIAGILVIVNLIVITIGIDYKLSNIFVF